VLIAAAMRPSADNETPAQYPTLRPQAGILALGSGALASLTQVAPGSDDTHITDSFPAPRQLLILAIAISVVPSAEAAIATHLTFKSAARLDLGGPRTNSVQVEPVSVVTQM
jgi:hypothetical protein